MTKMLTWLVLISALMAYGFLVLLFTFKGPIALTMHFGRLTATVGAMIVCMQAVPGLFEEVPPPRRDYLAAGINFMLLSAVCFSFWNEAGRIWNVDTSIFTSPVAGLFSLFLLIGATFVLIAPSRRATKVIALIVGVVVSIGLVFIAPLFR